MATESAPTAATGTQARALEKKWGKAAIDAALNPEVSKALYFVARGDGSSEFSNTLAEHNKAVDRYQRSAPKTQ